MSLAEVLAMLLAPRGTSGLPSVLAAEPSQEEEAVVAGVRLLETDESTAVTQEGWANGALLLGVTPREGP